MSWARCGGELELGSAEVLCARPDMRGLKCGGPSAGCGGRCRQGVGDTPEDPVFISARERNPDLYVCSRDLLPNMISPTGFPADNTTAGLRPRHPRDLHPRGRRGPGAGSAGNRRPRDGYTEKQAYQIKDNIAEEATWTKAVRWPRPLSVVVLTTRYPLHRPPL